MINEPTVLVLGAGASKPYGLPVGGELRSLILRMTDADLQRLPSDPRTGRDPYLLRAFREEFARSRYFSIERLGGPLGISAGAKLLESGTLKGRRFAATGYGLTTAEKYSAALRICQPNSHAAVMDGIKDMRCLQLLRETLILGP